MSGFGILVRKRNIGKFSNTMRVICPKCNKNLESMLTKLGVMSTLKIDDRVLCTQPCNFQSFVYVKTSMEIILKPR